MLLAMSIAEKFSSGGVTFTTGMLITFVVIGLLSVFMYLLKTIINKSEIYMDKRQKQNSVVVENNSVANNQIDEIIKDTVVDSMTLETVNIAVKLFMTQNNEKPHERYTIKSVKKIKLEA